MSFAPLLLLALAAPPNDGRQLLDRIVAVVNDEIITLSEVEAAAGPYLPQNDTEAKKQALYRDILDQLIAERLLSEQIKEAKIGITEEEVDRAIKDILRQNKIDEEDLKQAVESRGMSLGQYREDLKTQLIRLKIIDMKVRSRVVVPETDIKAEYDRQSRDEKVENLVKIRHIYFRYGDSPDPKEKARILGLATAARKRAVDGEDFGALATELSQGPTAAQGGDLGELAEAGLLPELAKVVKTMQPNTISQPIETINGVHVVRLEGRRVKESKAYAEQREQIYQRLYQKEVETQMKIWLDELRAQSAVEVRM
ncbi:MAG: peptidylprolyl isomerase [Deltaproteobacteria bacterium]|nr:peptidylprolyl isomerase [Deltaproteobacteria bacterium]